MAKNIILIFTITILFYLITYSFALRKFGILFSNTIILKSECSQNSDCGKNQQCCSLGMTTCTALTCCVSNNGM